MLPGTSVLVTYVLPFPLSLWGGSTTMPYTFKTYNAAVVGLSFLNVVFTDANPSYTVNYTFPSGGSDNFRINPLAFGGDNTHYTTSSYQLMVWQRTATNIFALALFNSWFLNAASVGTWRSSYPNSLTLTAGSTVDWFAAAQTGSMDTFSPSVQSITGFTFAARWSTSAAGCNATSDFVDTFVYATVSAPARQTTTTRPSSSMRRSWMLFVVLVVVFVRVFRLRPTISRCTAARTTRAFACA